MEEYINEKTIIKNEIYNSYKDFITCPLCSGIFINPVMCMKCQTAFCKKCADDWSLKNPTKCQKGCLEPNYEKCLSKKEFLSGLKFKCQKCQTEFQYDDAEEHSKSCGTGSSMNTPLPLSNKYKNIQSSKLEKISNDQMEELKKEGKEVLKITGKKKLFFLI